MPRKPFSDEEVFERLVRIEEHRANGIRVHTACRMAGVTDTTYYIWRRRLGVAAQKAAKTASTQAISAQS